MLIQSLMHIQQLSYFTYLYLFLIILLYHKFFLAIIHYHPTNQLSQFSL